MTARDTFHNYRSGKAICDIAVMPTAGDDCPADAVMLHIRAHLFDMEALCETASCLALNRKDLPARSELSGSG